MEATDKARSLRSPKARVARMQMLGRRHVAPLTRYVEELRLETGLAGLIPYFDPLDGGVHARSLFLFEAAGSGAVASGFISRNNDDDSAKNFFELNKSVDLDRDLTASWNTVPWYLGEGGRIKHPSTNEIEAGLRHLQRLLQHPLQSVEVIVLGGTYAQARGDAIRRLLPKLAILPMPHPSPQNLNTRPEQRDEIRKVLRKVKSLLGLES